MAFSSIQMGQYVPAQSIIHNLDPRAKMFLLICVMLFIFPLKDPVSLLCCAVALVSVIKISNLPPRMVIRSCRPVFFLALVTFVFNVVAGAGRGGASGILLGTAEGALAAARLLILVLFAVLLPLTTAPMEFADGLESMLSPAARFGFPAHECAMMMSVALRFIPLLMEETDRIVKAQVSRGAMLDQGNILKRVFAFFPILIPLFVIIFKRADELALAMEARGYRGGVGRTRRCPLLWKKSDTKVTIFVVFLLIAFYVIRRVLY